MRYPAFIEKEKGIYGVVFPNLLSVAVTGDTIEEAIQDAEAKRRHMTRTSYIDWAVRRVAAQGG